MLDRFAAFMLWLGTRPEMCVAVIAHHDFLKSNLGHSFAPGEVQTYTLVGGALRPLHGGGTPSRLNGMLKKELQDGCTGLLLVSEQRQEASSTAS